jgi:hypothetical protein
LAVNTTVDNAVIDYTAITSILQTVKSHDDLFVQFSTGSLGNIATDTVSGASVTPTPHPIPATLFLMQGATVQGNLSNGNAVVKVVWGQSFGSQSPIVTATPVMNVSTASLSTYIQSIDNTTGATIIINNSDSATKTAGFTLHVLALGTNL